MHVFMYLYAYGLKFKQFGLYAIVEWRNRYSWNCQSLVYLHVKINGHMLFQLYCFSWTNDSTFLQSAFSSTPLFEPFVIPLLLEKLSSSLVSAKVGINWIHTVDHLIFCLFFFLSMWVANIRRMIIINLSFSVKIVLQFRFMYDF